MITSIETAESNITSILETRGVAEARRVVKESVADTHVLVHCHNLIDAHEEKHAPAMAVNGDVDDMGAETVPGGEE
jgi:hypothetical protein